MDGPGIGTSRGPFRRDIRQKLADQRISACTPVGCVAEPNQRRTQGAREGYPLSTEESAEETSAALAWSTITTFVGGHVGEHLLDVGTTTGPRRTPTASTRCPSAHVNQPNVRLSVQHFPEVGPIRRGPTPDTGRDQPCGCEDMTTSNESSSAPKETGGPCWPAPSAPRWPCWKFSLFTQLSNASSVSQRVTT